MSIWEHLNPFSPYSIYYLMKEEDAKKAYRSVFGKEPTDGDVSNIIYGYLINKELYGDHLKNDNFVREIQRDLNNAIGYRVIAEDGKFYFKTVAAILMFQRKYGLKETGTLNKETISKLIEINYPNDFNRLKNLSHNFSSIKEFSIVVGGALLIFLLLSRRF